MITGAAGTSAAAGSAVRGEALQRTSNQTRQAACEQRAESAAGVGQAEQDEQIADRDVDGRLIWDYPTDAGHSEAPESSQPADPQQQTGRHLDLTG
jgi:hypothetical protein